MQLSSVLLTWHSTKSEAILCGLEKDSASDDASIGNRPWYMTLSCCLAHKI